MPNLALCSSFPRDVCLRIACLLLLCSLVIEAVAISAHSSHHAGGTIKINGVAQGKVAGHVAVYGPDGLTKICNPASAMLTRDCARYIESFHVLNGLLLTSIIGVGVCFLYIVFVAARLGGSSLDMVQWVFVLVCVPFSVHCGAVGVFFSQTLPHAKSIIQASAGSTSSTSYNYAWPVVLMLVTLIVMGFAFVVVLGRLIFGAVFSLVFASKLTHTPAEIEMMKRLYIINDDWERQKQILRSHAKSVQVEIKMKNENVNVDTEHNDGSDGGGGADNVDSSSREPFSDIVVRTPQP